MTENNNRNKEGAGSTHISSRPDDTSAGAVAGGVGGDNMTEGTGHPNGAQSGPPRTDGVNTAGAQSVDVPPPRTDGLNTAGNDNYVSTNARS